MQTMQPFMIIADFETFSNKLNQIKPYSFGMFIHCIFDENNNQLSYFTIKSCLDKFFVHLKYHVNKINKIKARPNPYSNSNAYKNNTNEIICLICNKEILTNKPHAIDIIVKKTGYFYGLKHSESKGRKNQLTILCHNGSKFDFRLIISYLAEKSFDSNISCISNSMKTFLTFSVSNFDNTIMNIRFIDSYKDLSSPLDGIVKSLLNNDTDINSIKNKFPSLCQYFEDKAFNLLRKRVYPYDYMDENWEKRLKEKELPNIEYFNSSLSNTKFNTKSSIEDYNYAKETYNFFGCKKKID